MFLSVLVMFFSQLAQQYDMLIIEDDPYYFLQFDKVRKASRDASFLSFDLLKKRRLTSDVDLRVPACCRAAVGALLPVHGRRRENHQDGLFL